MGPHRKLGSQELKSSTGGQTLVAQHPRAWEPSPVPFLGVTAQESPPQRVFLRWDLGKWLPGEALDWGVFSLQVVANRFHRVLHPLLPFSLPKTAMVVLGGAGEEEGIR